MKSLRCNTTLILLFVLLISINCPGQANPQKPVRVFNKKPKLGLDTKLKGLAKTLGFVNDYDKIYSPEQVYEMDSLLYDFETRNSIQIIVVTFDSVMVQSVEIEEATTAIGNAWKVGGDSSKGMVIGISRAKRQMRIENGKPVQKILSDSKTKEIIDSVFLPEFKKGLYFEGTLLGIKAIMYELENAVKLSF